VVRVRWGFGLPRRRADNLGVLGPEPLNDVIADVFDVSRIVSGKVRIDVQVIDAAAVRGVSLPVVGELLG
jgi:hypothetical protein